MRRITVMTAIAVAALVARPSSSEACSKSHQSPFELFEYATTVAYATVAVVPPPTTPGYTWGPGPVELVISRAIKGSATARIVSEESNTSCHAGFELGKDIVVFLAANGHVVGASEGILREPKIWQAILDAWAAAKTPAERAAILVDGITGKDGTVAHDSAYYLVDDPEMLATLDDAQKKRLVAAAKPGTIATLPLLLARLRLVTTGPSFLGIKKFESITDPAKLAAAIEAGRGADDPNRIAAFERCERVHGKKLVRFNAYRAGVATRFWKVLAEICRTGTPP